MSSKNCTLLVSMVTLAFAASPCAAQVIFVRDPAGYVRSVAIQQPTTFSLGFQAQAVVSGDGTFVKVNATPFGLSMFDPAATPLVAFPAPNLGIFSDGRPQPAFMNQ